MGWLTVVVGAAIGVAGCGEDSVTPVEDPDVIAPFVGIWDAKVFVVTSTADPEVDADLLLNGSFDIVIEPSGLYTATLVLGALGPLVEIGQLSVTGSVLTLRPNGPNPCPGSSEYSFSTPTYLVLDGPTCFDFNLDDVDEDAEAHVELQRR